MSQITVTIMLEPFLQEMIRGIYNQHNPVFRFPNGDELSLRLRNLLRPLPPDYKTEDFGENTFEIEIPASEDRDPFYYRYLSATATKAFTRKISEFVRMHYHERLIELRNDGYEYQMCIDLFMDEYEISQDHIDRLIKDAYRWRVAMRKKKCQKNASKKKHVLSFA